MLLRRVHLRRVRGHPLSYIQEILDAGKEYFSGVTWLSEESRANIVKKIDSMIIRCGVSDDARSLYDYSSVDTSDGLYEYIIGLKKVNVKAELSQMDRSRENICSFVWTMATQNASYCLDDNSITVLAAHVYENLGDITTASEADIATYVTFTVAHELTHAFDGNGCQYDENGTRRDNAVLTAVDRNTFQERRDRLVQYLDGLVVYDDGTTVTHVNGGNTVDEVIADLGESGDPPAQCLRRPMSCRLLRASSSVLSFFAKCRRARLFTGSLKKLDPGTAPTPTTLARSSQNLWSSSYPYSEMSNST